MYRHYSTNKHGVCVSHHICDTCKQEFSICPMPPNLSDWDHCYADNCESYDPERDADILFMTDDEIAREKKIVSIKQLRARNPRHG